MPLWLSPHAGLGIAMAPYWPEEAAAGWCSSPLPGRGHSQHSWEGLSFVVSGPYQGVWEPRISPGRHPLFPSLSQTVTFDLTNAGRELRIWTQDEVGRPQTSLHCHWSSQTPVVPEFLGMGRGAHHWLVVWVPWPPDQPPQRARRPYLRASSATALSLALQQAPLSNFKLRVDSELWRSGEEKRSVGLSPVRTGAFLS